MYLVQKALVKWRDSCQSRQRLVPKLILEVLDTVKVENSPRWRSKTPLITQNQDVFPMTTGLILEVVFLPSAALRGRQQIGRM